MILISKIHTEQISHEKSFLFGNEGMGEQMGLEDEGRTNLKDLKTYQKMQRRSYYHIRNTLERK